MGSPLKISPDDLVAMDEMAPPQRLRIELAYARAENTLFGERIYRTDAKLWLHTRLAAVVLTAANAAYAQGFRLVLYDGLRTTSAQARMLETARVKANPHSEVSRVGTQCILQMNQLGLHLEQTILGKSGHG